MLLKSAYTVTLTKRNIKHTIKINWQEIIFTQEMTKNLKKSPILGISVLVLKAVKGFLRLKSFGLECLP